MLELWRPPEKAGEPIGCIATTYTFDPGLFDERCLGSFLEIESEPDREDLAFLLERENRLGSVYAGVLVDHTQAGVPHSLRWDVLPVRVRAGKQHAKLSLLAWSRHIRIIVASANLTEQGYRRNREVAASVDLSPADANGDLLMQAISFLRDLLSLVPGAQNDTPEVDIVEDRLSRLVRRPRLRLVASRADVRDGTCVPLVPLAAAAGVFGDPHTVPDQSEWEWVEVETARSLRRGMFVAQVVGHSMEPAIPDGAYCLFASPVTGTRQGKTVLVQLRDGIDPDTGERFTVKRYRSEKATDAEGWRHVRILLEPTNPDFAPIELTTDDEDSVTVVAELVEAIGTTPPA